MSNLRVAELRHAAHYASVLGKAQELYLKGGNCILDGLGLLDENWSNIQAGQAYAEKYGGVDEEAAKLCSAYAVHDELLELRQHPRERIHWQSSALSAALRLRMKRAEGWHLNNLGAAYTALGDNQTAIKLYEQYLAIARISYDRRGEGEALGNLGLAYAHMGDVRRAIEFFTHRLEFVNELNDKRAEGNTLTNLGMAYASLGDNVRAVESLERALEIAREIGDKRGEGHALGNLGYAYNLIGESKRAIGYIEHHLAIARELGDRRGQGNALANLGLAYADSGDLWKSIEIYKQALTIAREIDDRLSETNLLNNLGASFASLGDVSRAIEFHEQALIIAREIDDRRSESVELINLGLAYRGAGKIEESVECYEQALVIARENSDRRTEVQVLIHLGAAYNALKEADRAAEYYRQALGLARRNQDPIKVAEILTSLGALARERNDFNQAKQLLNESAEIYQKFRHPLYSSIISLLRELETSQESVIPLLETAQNFFSLADFTLTLIPETNIYKCEHNSDSLVDLLPNVIYARFLLNEELDDAQALTIREQVLQIDNQASVAFAITTHRPTDQGWAQIGLLRNRRESFIVLPLESALLSEGLATKRARQLLRTEVEKRMGSFYDPYDVRDPVAGAFSFFGRDTLIDTLLHRISEGRPIGVFGLRKLGKSSLLRAIERRASFPVAVINLQTLGNDSLRQFYARVMRYWKDWVRVKYSIDWQFPVLTSEDSTETFVGATLDLLNLLEYESVDARLGIFLDEVETIVPKYDGSGANLNRYLTLFRTLRGLVDEDGRLSLIVAGLNPTLNRINSWEGVQNPTFNLFQEYNLPPLAHDDCAQMVRNIGQQVGLVYEPESLQSINLLSGGHPFLARQLCSVLFGNRDYQPGRIEQADIPASVHQFIYDDITVTHLDAGIWQDVGNASLWGSDNARVNQEILLELARAGNPVKMLDITSGPNSDARQATLFNLERFQVIFQPEPDTFAIRFGLLQKWLRQRKLGLQ